MTGLSRRSCAAAIAHALVFMAMAVGEARQMGPYGPLVTIKPVEYGIAGSKVEVKFSNNGVVRAEVRFDDHVVPFSGDIHVSPIFLFFNVPSDAAPGWHKVAVTAWTATEVFGQGTICVYRELKFMVLPSNIRLLNFEPDSAPPGSTITLLADGLDCDLPFSTVRYAVVISSPTNPLGTQLDIVCAGNTPRVHLPASLTPGKVFVKIRADFKALILSPHVVTSNAIAFNMVLGPPELVGVEHGYIGQLGSEVTLEGYNFRPLKPPPDASMIVHFGNVKVPATYLTNGQLKVKVPMFKPTKGADFVMLSVQLERRMGNEVKYSNIITIPFTVTAQRR